MTRRAGTGRPLPAPLLMVASCALFALMGVCVKAASAHYPAADLVFYRCGLGALFVLGLARWRRVGLRTPVPGMHLGRGLFGVGGLMLWFHSLGGLPLATAMTLNAMSSVWMAVFALLATLLPSRRGRGPDPRMMAAVGAGFLGVVLVLRPTLGQDQLWHGMAGLVSGVLAALAYRQLVELGRAGEPEERTVWYFSLFGLVLGAVAMAAGGGPQSHTPQGLALVLSMATLATVAQLLMTRAYATGRPLANATLQYLGIAFSLLLGVWLFDDPLTPSALAGIALIVAAGISVTGLGPQPPRRAAAASRPGDT